MNGFIRKTVAGLCLSAGLASLGGCYCYRNLVDPCWPERYNAQSRHAVDDTFNAQAANGHMLDQTVWNYHFEVDPKTGAGTDRLNLAGQEHLKYLARRRPAPDPKVYLQTAQDYAGLAALPLEKMAPARTDLDNRRSQAVRGYLATLGKNVEFEVAVHDPNPAFGSGMSLPIVGIKGPIPEGSIPDNYKGYKGAFPPTIMFGPGTSSK